MRHLLGFRYIPFFVLALLTFDGRAQGKKDDLVFVDANGVMRWTKSKKEVQGFGVNYTAPFAHAYRSAKKLNVSVKQAIDNDVYHFARLGFDAYRVHVWDTEISDTVGNLLTNDHLELFDHMLKKMKDRGMRMILTPIAFWGNGFPDPDEKTPGFSKKYGKGDCLTNEDAIKAQENYLFQFFNHVNPNTGVAYKDDPDILAFEISNEPHHNESADKVTAYINRMVSSIRKTGCKKPIFYNISHSIHLVNAYFDANIQGGTFQWYPTGLGAQEELGGNLLPNVDLYKIPFASNPKFKKSAKIVYEFDAADVGRSYIYPAMARSFREAGIQWATHFAYDPTYLAYANTEYSTHYMNLVYAPQKALSLKLASEVFHRVPMYTNYGKYPANTKFDAFRVSYEEDLAEMVTANKFIYTNNTSTTPPSPEKLDEIAGFGDSKIITYEGRGAYFLDKIENGTWRLEVMPDAIWVNDPFGRNNLDKVVAVVNWRTWTMSIDLADLGKDFSVKAINQGNDYNPPVTNASFAISPGTYLLTRKGVTPKVTSDTKWKNIVLKEFVAPKTSVRSTYVLHNATRETTPGSLTIDASVISVTEPESVEVNLLTGFRSRSVRMEKTTGYHYAVTLPADVVTEGFLRYFITVKENGKATSYPVRSNDGKQAEPYVVNVVSASAPIYLFDALKDNDRLARGWNRGLSFVPTGEPGKAEIRVNIEKLFTVDVENPKAEKIYDYSMRFYFRDDIRDRASQLNTKKDIVFHGRALNGKPAWVQVAFITRKGETYGGVIKLEGKSDDYRLPVADLKSVKFVTLPRPYPTFLPYFFDGNSQGSLNLSDIETVQISIGPGIPQDALDESHGVAVESIRLE